MRNLMTVPVRKNFDEAGSANVTQMQAAQQPQAKAQPGERWIVQSGNQQQQRRQFDVDTKRNDQQALYHG